MCGTREERAACLAKEQPAPQHPSGDPSAHVTARRNPEAAPRRAATLCAVRAVLGCSPGHAAPSPILYSILDSVGSGACVALKFWVDPPLPPFFLSFLCLCFIGMTKPFNYVRSKQS